MSSIFARKGRAGVTLEYVDPATGRTRFRQFPDRESAEAFKKRKLREARLTRSPDENTTVEEYALRWLGQVKDTLRAGTARGYASMLDNHIIPALGSKLLRKLRRVEVKDFVSGLIAKPPTGKGLSKKTAGNVRFVLHACLEAAVEDLPELVTHNPAAFRSKSRLLLSTSRAERRAKIKALTETQREAFLKAAREVVPERYPILRFIAGTGVRSGEALGLQLDDVDVERGQVLIRRSITEGREAPTKTGHERTVDLGPGLLEEMRTWLATAKAERLAGPRGPWMFSSDEKPIRLRRLEDDFKAAAKAASLPPWHTPHHLRHTYASIALRRGVSIYYVQRQLGHASITMTTDLYGSWLPAGDAAAAALIEANAAEDVSPSASAAGPTRPKRASTLKSGSRKSLKLVARQK